MKNVMQFHNVADIIIIRIIIYVMRIVLILSASPKQQMRTA